VEIFDNAGIGACWIFVRSGSSWLQQGPKLVGTGYVVPTPDNFVGQGESVAISADGNTVAFGGIYDNNSVGAAWVFARQGGVWTQQGGKLVGIGGDTSQSNFQFQGSAVALSPSGDRLFVGAPYNGSIGTSPSGAGIGGTYVFTRNSANVWTQQGTGPLIGTGSVGPSCGQGYSLALSSDGATLAVGANQNNVYQGATWIFVLDKTLNSFVQQGSSLVGTGATGNGQQGFSVALSANGNTLAVGCAFDNNLTGATWIFTRSSNGVWTQLGNKIVAVGPAQGAQGSVVALNALGTTLLIGAPNTNDTVGSAYVFTAVTQPNGTIKFVEQKMLTPNDGNGYPAFGYAVALDASGKIGIIGGPSDNESVGAAWIFD